MEQRLKNMNMRGKLKEKKKLGKDMKKIIAKIDLEEAQQAQRVKASRSSKHSQLESIPKE